MLITVLGSAGLGLVWGWLVGSSDGQTLPRLRTTLALTGATVLLAFEVLLLTDWRTLIIFLSTTLLALLLRLEWRHELRKRFDSLI